MQRARRRGDSQPCLSAARGLPWPPARHGWEFDEDPLVPSFTYRRRLPAPWPSARVRGRLPRLAPPLLAITDDGHRLALRSTRNRPRTAVRRGAGWTGECYLPLSGRGGGRAFLAVSVLLSCPGCWSSRRRLAGRACGRRPSGRASLQRSGRPGRHASVAGPYPPYRCPSSRFPMSSRPVSSRPVSSRPVSSRPVSDHLFRRPGSGCPTDWVSARPASGTRHPASGVRRPAVRCPPGHLRLVRVSPAAALDHVGAVGQSSRRERIEVHVVCGVPSGSVDGPSRPGGAMLRRWCLVLSSLDPV
jgi:hypothetical protein